MLAKTLNLQKHEVRGMFASEKLDGFRVLWDGGVSRGMAATLVPWANTAKDARYLSPPVATGLWSRYGKVVHAPEWFLDRLPIGTILDGELFAGRKQFQPLRSAQKLIPYNEAWKKLSYHIFDAPCVTQVFADRTIADGERFKKRFYGIKDWYINQMDHDPIFGQMASYGPRVFHQTVLYLENKGCWNDTLKFHKQLRLDFSNDVAIKQLEVMLDLIEEKGGEGVMLRAPFSLYQTSRSWDLLKMKSYQDMEVTVVGYTWGRETDKGSKLLGKMGAAIVKDGKGNVFKVSGFTDAEREMCGPDTCEGIQFPGSEASDIFENPNFKRGTEITIKYRELTDVGIPKEARYWRNAL